MTFESWLRKQKIRKNWTGLLADAFIKSKCKKIEDYFIMFPPSKETLVLLQQAKTEWSLIR